MSRAMAPAVAAAGFCSRLSLISCSRRVVLRPSVHGQCRSSSTDGILGGRVLRSSVGLRCRGSMNNGARMSTLRFFGTVRFPAHLTPSRSFSSAKSATEAVVEEEEADTELRSLKDVLKTKDVEIDALNNSLKDQEAQNELLKKENTKMMQEMQELKDAQNAGKSVQTAQAKARQSGSSRNAKISPKAVAAQEDESDMDLSDDLDDDDSELDDLTETDSDVEDSLEETDSEFEKEFGKLSGSDSEFDARMEDGKEVSDMSDVEDVLARKTGPRKGRITKKRINTSVGGDVMETWKSFVSVLRKKNYFVLQSEDLVAGEAAYEDFGNIQGALKRFSIDRDDILKNLPVDDLKVLAKNGCPSIDRKVVNSGKRIRGHLDIVEGDVCQSCTFRDGCSRAYLPPDSTATTTDAMQYLFQFVVTLSDGKDIPEKVKTATKNILTQLISLSSIPRDPTLPRELVEQVSKPSTAPKKKAHGRNADVEMKPGDWKCEQCDYVNFCRNRHCRECHTPRPPQDMRPGDWECPECRFINFSRNEECHDCKAERPKPVKVFHKIKGTKEKWEGTVSEFAGVADKLERKSRGQYSDGLDDDSDDDFKPRSKKGGTKSMAKNKKWDSDDSDDDDLDDLDDDSDDDLDFKSKKAVGKKQSKNEAWDDDSDDSDEDDLDSEDFESEDDVKASKSRGAAATGGALRGRGTLTRGRGEDEPRGGFRGRGGGFSRGRGRGGRASLADTESDDASDMISDMESDEDDDFRRGSRGGRGGRGGGSFSRGRGRGRASFGDEDAFSDDGDETDDEFSRSSRGGRGGRSGSFGSFGRGRGSFGRGRGGRSSSFDDDDASFSDDGDGSDDDFSRGRGRGRGRGGFRGGGRSSWGDRDGGGGRSSWGDRNGDRDDFRGGGFRGGRSSFGDRDGGGGGFRGGGGRSSFGDRRGGGRSSYGDRDDFRGGDREERDSFSGGRGGYRGGGGGYRGGRGGGGGGGFRGGGRFGKRESF